MGRTFRVLVFSMVTLGMMAACSDEQDTMSSTSEEEASYLDIIAQNRELCSQITKREDWEGY